MGDADDEHNRGGNYTEGFLVRYPKEKENLQELCVDGRIILKCILNK
jgi:hypothetical protein